MNSDYIFHLPFTFDSKFNYLSLLICLNLTFKKFFQGHPTAFFLGLLLRLNCLCWFMFKFTAVFTAMSNLSLNPSSKLFALLYFSIPQFPFDSYSHVYIIIYIIYIYLCGTIFIDLLSLCLILLF